MILRRLWIVAAILVTTACGSGTSGDNGPDPFGSQGNTPDNLALSLTVLDESCSGDTVSGAQAGETLCVVASLTNNGISQSGRVIGFTAPLGSLSVASRVTNDNGDAQVFITSAASDIGAAVVTASIDSVEASGGYEFLGQIATANDVPSVSLVLVRNGDPVSRISAGDAAQLRASVVTRDGNPVADTLVSFTSDLGTLVTDAAVTSQFGVAEVSLTTTEGQLGAAIATASIDVDNQPFSDAINFQIQAAGAVDEGSISVGHFDNDNFVANQIGTSIPSQGDRVVIASGATLGLRIAVVDNNGQRVQEQVPVTLSSTCANNGLASLDSPVSTINGEAFSTFTDLGCGGANGNLDEIQASLSINNAQRTLTQLVAIEPETIGSISFIGASPENIVLQGSGGVDSSTSSVVTFQVNGASGNPLSQQLVDFDLNSTVGGLSLASNQGLTNSQGQVSTLVRAGTVPTAVRVTASTELSSGVILSTQSELLTVNTGLPDQNSFSLGISSLNPEAFAINGVEVTVTARLGDSFNNPVPDGTGVSFTTEGGTIAPSCVTSNGSCSVIWTSSAPRPADHRVTVLATAIGHETLIDANGNNAFDDPDGGPISDGNDNGFAISLPAQSGFVDHSEAWRDDDEDGTRDVSEPFIDFDGNASFDVADGLFNGPQCIDSQLCGQGIDSSSSVRRAAVLIVSSSSAQLSLSPSVTAIPRGDTQTFTLSFSDSAGQVVPQGSIINVSTSGGLLSGATAFTVPSTTSLSVGGQLIFAIENNLGDGVPADTATITATLTTPSGVQSSLPPVTVTLN